MLRPSAVMATASGARATCTANNSGIDTDTGAAPQQPEIPAVVQTDGVTAPSAGWPAWALGLGAAAVFAGA